MVAANSVPTNSARQEAPRPSAWLVRAHGHRRYRRLPSRGQLEHALREIVGNDRCWHGREVPLPVGRRRWDMSYETNQQIIVVEFDGDEHYRNTP